MPSAIGMSEKCQERKEKPLNNERHSSIAFGAFATSIATTCEASFAILLRQIQREASRSEQLRRNLTRVTLFKAM
jgi:hypothetical protein